MGISYSAIVLDEMSKQNILGMLGDYIPSGWTAYAHHMTITMGPLVHPKESKRRKGHDYSAFGPPGTPHNLTVTELGLDERAMAVKVASPFPTRNDQKGGFAHITIAVNTAEGGKPFHSNKIPLENFKSLAELGLPAITVKGTVQEVPN
tara:strand:- start:40 stop:486 length:447 start_codon:yes stop_codon:yes gene_type:complete